METHPARTVSTRPYSGTLPPRAGPLRSLSPPIAPLPRTGDQATIGKGLLVKGEITGSESLYIDGKVEGSINLPGNRVTVGRNGQVAASITAREIVILGKVRGNVSASDRVEIRAEGSLTGDVSAARISIEDGAFFKGGIDIRKPEAKPAATPAVPRGERPSRSRRSRVSQVLLNQRPAGGGLCVFGRSSRFVETGLSHCETMLEWMETN